MTKAKAKPKRKKAAPKVEVTSFTQLEVPVAQDWEFFSKVMADKLAAKDQSFSSQLDVAVNGDCIVFAMRGCDESFIMHKDTFAELAEALS